VVERPFISVAEIRSLLVQDRLNLRTIGNIRYYRCDMNGYVLVHPDEEISLTEFTDCPLQLQLEKSTSKSNFMGPMFCVDPNIACIRDVLNPVCTLNFMAAGKQHTRKYRANLVSFGAKFEMSVRFQFVWFFKAPFRLLYQHESIEFGRGMILH